MAHIVTIKVLVDDTSEEQATSVIREMGAYNSVIDFEVESIQAVAPELADSICNETYQQGDAFRPWLLYSSYEAWKGGDSGERPGYWSNSYGWTDLNLATHFDPVLMNRPVADGGVVLVLMNNAEGSRHA